MWPLRGWPARSQAYSSSQRQPWRSRDTTPPSAVEPRNGSTARIAASRNVVSSMVSKARQSTLSARLCAIADFHGCRQRYPIPLQSNENSRAPREELCTPALSHSAQVRNSSKYLLSRVVMYAFHAANANWETCTGLYTIACLSPDVRRVVVNMPVRSNPKGDLGLSRVP